MTFYAKQTILKLQSELSKIKVTMKNNKADKQRRKNMSTTTVAALLINCMGLALIAIRKRREQESAK